MIIVIRLVPLLNFFGHTCKLIIPLKQTADLAFTNIACTIPRGLFTLSSCKCSLMPLLKPLQHAFIACSLISDPHYRKGVDRALIGQLRLINIENEKRSMRWLMVGRPMQAHRKFPASLIKSGES